MCVFHSIREQIISEGETYQEPIIYECFIWKKSKQPQPFLSGKFLIFCIIQEGKRKNMNSNFVREDLNMLFEGEEGLQWNGQFNQTFQLLGKDFVEPTQEVVHVQILSRSLKNKVPGYQISFEENLLDEHVELLHKKGKNLMEAAVKESAQPNSVDLRFWREEDDVSFDDLHVDDNELIYQEEKNQFKKDLENEANLKSLLEVVANKVTEQAGKELTYISMLVWEHYLKVKTLYFSLADLEKAAEDFTKKMWEELFESHKMRFFNFSETEENKLKPIETLQKNFEEFLKFWATTVLLVIEEYFQNTYADNKAIKRERNYSVSDFSDEFSNQQASFLGFPSKKMLSYNEIQE